MTIPTTSTIDYRNATIRATGLIDPSAGKIGMPPFLSALFCFVLSMSMHLPWLAITPIAGTEGHRIFPAHAMVQTHWWLVPTLFDQPFMTKPPLHHWLIATCEMLGGGGDAFNVAGPKALFLWRLPSAITGALLCSAVAWFGARWFGRMAGLVSGMCAVGMVAIWGQSQVADIDSTNTLATALTALCGVELLIVRPRQRGGWLIAASLAMGAMWMTKGPAGLPIVLGVWFWAAAVVAYQIFRAATPELQNDNPSSGINASAQLATPVDSSPSTSGTLAYRVPEPARSQNVAMDRAISIAFWFLPLLMGVAIFLLWAWAAKMSLVSHGMQLDRRGVKEGTDRLLAKNWRVLLESTFKMLPQVIAFGLPITLCVPLYFGAGIRQAMATRQRRIATSLAAATFISWGVCVISGMVNPRYAYPTLMLLCPLAGAVAVVAVKIPRAADWLRGFGFLSAVAFLGATVGLSIGARHADNFRVLLIACSAIAVIVAPLTIWRLHHSWRGAWGLVVLILLASVPFGVQRHWARTTTDSGINSAAAIRHITGENAVIAVCGAATSKPEAFYYARVHPNFIPLYDFIPQHVQGGTWIMLDQAEHKRWLKQPNSRLENDQKICRWGVTDYYLAWYPAPPEGSPQPNP